MHLRCDTCGTLKRVHINAYGEVDRRVYVRTEAWVSYTRDLSPTSSDRRLAYIKVLGKQGLVAKGPKQAKVAPKEPEGRHLRAVG